MKYEPDAQPARPIARRAPSYTERQAVPYEPRPCPEADFVALKDPCPEADFVALKEWMRVRAPHLSPSLDHTEDGADFIPVTLAPSLIPQELYRGRSVRPMVTPYADVVAIVIRSDRGWLVHHPEDGPLFEFEVAPQVAEFLSGRTEGLP